MSDLARLEKADAPPGGMKTHHPEERRVSEGLVLVDGGEDAEDEACQNNEEPEEGQKYSEHQFLLPKPQIYPDIKGSRELVWKPLNPNLLKDSPSYHTQAHENLFFFFLGGDK